MACNDTNTSDGSCIDVSNNDDDDITADKTENLIPANIEHMRCHVLEAKSMIELVNEKD